MNTLSTAGLLLLTAALTIPAVAKTRSEGVTLYHDAVVNGTTLPAGDYVVRYDVDGTNAQVSFVRNSKVVATATGQMKQLNDNVQHNQVVLSGEGTPASISEIDFGGKHSGITFGNTATAAGK